eukprot:sb/3464926/
MSGTEEIHIEVEGVEAGPSSSLAPPSSTNPSCSIALHEISLASDNEDTDSIKSLRTQARKLLSEEVGKSEAHSSAYTSEIAIDQTWSEWMQELPGSTWGKICKFTTVQWRWSKNLVTYTHLPDWLKDNKFLISRHRLPIYSFTGCIFSAFRLHTETGNIWTHLIGSILTLGFSIYCYASRLHARPWSEQLVYGMFFMAATICMGFSCLFHTVINHSPEMFKLFSRLDYSGISLLMVGSYIPWLYYAYFCSPVIYTVYTSTVCFIGIIGIIVSLWEKFDKPKYRTFRAAVFLSMGLSAIIPGFHYGFQYGWDRALDRASLGWMVLMGCLYVTGTLLYMLQIPERWFPGKFDVWGQSHQLFHIFVLVAVFVHYHGVALLEEKHLVDILNEREGESLSEVERGRFKVVVLYIPCVYFCCICYCRSMELVDI